jgi:hypothetical protein
MSEFIRYFLFSASSEGGKGWKETEAKIRILEQNAHIHQLYMHLVKE